MYNPYKFADFTKNIISVSHAHCKTQPHFEKLVSAGVQHYALSNYYPSAPWYPLSAHFENVPSNAISCPNAEYARFTGSSSHFHVNGIGSMFSCGNSEDTSPHTSWNILFTNVLRNLQYSDGGGIVINHPYWSDLTTDEVINYLKYDKRVLGIEIFNYSCEVSSEKGWSLEMWDEILSQGIQCFGFCVPDHAAQYYDVYGGYNHLLCEPTEHECLKAYRSGAFYSSIYNSNLVFKNILYKKSVVSVQTENADRIEFITKNGRKVIYGNSATYSVKSHDVYVRIEAHNEENSIFSNAIMLPNYTSDDFIFFYC